MRKGFKSLVRLKSGAYDQIKGELPSSDGTQLPKILMHNLCVNCNSYCNNIRAKYCSNNCHHEWQYKSYIEKWLNGEVSGGSDRKVVVVP